MRACSGARAEQQPALLNIHRAGKGLDAGGHEPTPVAVVAVVVVAVVVRRRLTRGLALKPRFSLSFF